VRVPWYVVVKSKFVLVVAVAIVPVRCGFVSSRFSHMILCLDVCCQPQRPNLVATHTGGASLSVYDLHRHPSKPVRDGVAIPDMRLRGHKKQGSTRPSIGALSICALAGASRCIS
jgi:hypothetical protein